jgi:ribosomal protein S18 acetylase RimI-like enzyme
MFARKATKEDIELVLEIFNAHEQHLEPELGTNGVEWAEDFIQGFPDPCPAWLISDSEESVPFAAGNLNPSANAERFQVEISIRPEVDRAEEVLKFFREKATEFAPEWAFWIDCNLKDKKFIQALEDRGFMVNRYYNGLRRELQGETERAIPDGVSMGLVDFTKEEDMRIWNNLRMDAFARHFGFVPRPFEQFQEIMLRDPLLKITEVHILYEHGIPAGYLWINDKEAHELIGYVANLGVAHAYQGKGYGEFLLHKALAIYAGRGFKYVELGVDIANESGALRLYDKMGFRKVTTCVQYED